MTKFLVVFDVDSTLIEDEAIELLADRAGERQRVAEITERAMRGELDFAESLIERVAVLRGLPETVLEETASILRPTFGSTELVSEIHRRQGVALAVSGGFIQLLDPIQASIGFDYAVANTLEVSDGRLTGQVKGDIIDREAKANALRSHASDLGLSLSETIAVGDGANDLAMMEVAGLSIAFCAKPAVQQRADLALNTRDLSLLIQVLPK